MGVGYQVSPLHGIVYSDPVEGAPPEPPPQHILEMMANMPPGMPRMQWDGRPRAFRSPVAEDIIAWRAKFSRQHQSELGEDVDWDEQSVFVWAEDVRTSDDTNLRYLAAAIDQLGASEAATIVGLSTLPDGAMAAGFAESDRRGSAVRFPQLLMGARYWLPFRRSVVIASTTWRGELARFGSVDALAAELDEIRSLVAEIDPSVITLPAEASAPPRNVLSSAWQAGDTVLRLTTLALTQGLPLWTTG
jgi:hypothetical protein